MLMNNFFKVTRAVLSAFKRDRFSDIYKTAGKTVNIIFVAEICPELETLLSLRQPRPILKRRQSTPSKIQTKIKRRRYSCAAGNLLRVFLFSKYIGYVFLFCRHLSADHIELHMLGTVGKL